MKLLLTSAGIKNQTLKDSLKELLAKPFVESTAVFIPTATTADDDDKTWLIDNLSEVRDCGFKYIDIVDISAVEMSNWRPRLERADVIFVGGGNSFTLMWWIAKSGLQEVLPELLKEKVYVGISAGTVVVCPQIDLPDNALFFEDETNEHGIRKGMELVDYCIVPHFNSPDFSVIREKAVRKVREELGLPLYAIDDQSAIRVVGGKTDLVGEGDPLSLP